MKLAVVVLAAGKGTRMKSERAKVLHAVAGRAMIEYPVELARALGAQRAIFFHDAGGVFDSQTQMLIDELTPAEALDLAADAALPADLRAAIRHAALGVRGGVGAAQILDGRIQHATIVELLTARHLGTRVTGAVFVG